MVTGRERDPSGRARNARPRDELGRPLARGSAGVGRVPDDFVLPPAESLVEAQRLLDAGLPFHAHEVLEGTWKASPPSERELWRGLAQIAVGLTHLRRGNLVGGAALLRRAALRLADYVQSPPHGVDVAGLCVWVDDVLAAVPSMGQVAPPSGFDAGSLPVPRLRGWGALPSDES